MSAYDSMRAPASSHGGNQYAAIFSGTGLIALGIGAIAGLLIGLLIGWVIWPVEWTNAWPNDLSPEAKAQYLAAVAESYAYYGDEAAAAAAQARLNSFGEDLAAEIAAAQDFFSENPSPNSRVHISNLGILATQLGLESPGIVTSPEELPQTDAGATEAPETTQPSPDSSRTWLTWALTAVAALLLIGGGIYLIVRLSRVRQSVIGRSGEYSGAVDEFDDEFDGEPFFEEEVPPFEQSGRREDGTSFAQSEFETVSSFGKSEDDVYEFDDESDDNLVYSPARSIDRLSGFDDDEDDGGTETDRSRSGRSEARRAEHTSGRDGELDTNAFDDVEDSGFADDDFDPSDTDRSPRFDSDSSVGSAAIATSAPAEPATVTLHRPRPHKRDGEETQDGPVDGQDAASAVSTSGKLDQLGSFVSLYQLGIPDFDEFFNITDDSGDQVGGCGMGVNMKRGSLPDNPDCAIALDVWLMERSGSARPQTQTRLLLSEYVVEHSLEKDITRDLPSGAPSPLVAQPGLSFRVAGNELLLDCRVIDVRYVENGPLEGVFETLEVEMVVRSRQ